MIAARAGLLEGMAVWHSVFETAGARHDGRSVEDNDLANLARAQETPRQAFEVVGIRQR